MSATRKPRCTEMGWLYTVDTPDGSGIVHAAPYALLIEFLDPQSLREALERRSVEFEIGPAEWDEEDER